MSSGACLALFLCDAEKIVRPDGSRVILMKNLSWWTEFHGLWETIRAEPWIILLFPMFWSSNWFYTYQQNGINAAHFDTRTKALNGFLYWFAQIVAAALIGPLLDIERFRRGIRARIGLVVLFALTVGMPGRRGTPAPMSRWKRSRSASSHRLTGPRGDTSGLCFSTSSTACTTLSGRALYTGKPPFPFLNIPQSHTHSQAH